MSRKTLIFCLSALAVMVLGIGIAVAFLYSGSSEGGLYHNEESHVDGRGLLFSAVPSDAVLVASFADACKASDGALAGFPFFDVLAQEFKKNKLSVLKRCNMTVSLHYSGKLCPLYVFETGRSDTEISEEESELMDFLKNSGLYSQRVKCAEISRIEGRLSKSTLVLASVSENVVRSSERHLKKGVSVVDSPGFADVLSEISGDDLLFVSNLQVGKLLPAMLSSKYNTYSSFLASVADWSAFAITSEGGSRDFSGAFYYDSDPSDFMNVMESLEPGKITVGEILPSYTLSAFSFAVKNASDWSESYRRYLDSRQKLQRNNAARDSMTTKLGMTPVDYMKKLEVSEIANASFIAGSKVQRVNLMKADDPDVSQIFKGLDVESLRDYEPKVHDYRYSGLAASVFGHLFHIDDETSFTYKDGWIISGPKLAVKEFISALNEDYPLSSYLSDAGESGISVSHHSIFRSYISLTEALQHSADVFSKQFAGIVSDYAGDCDFACVISDIKEGKDSPLFTSSVRRLVLQKTKAPVEERDTLVVIPKGPFKVKNSGTGKENLFYQNKHLSLCLQQDGKDLWGVPFKEQICGTAYNVDYYANGKLQILFGAGESLYVIDRLGRYVNGFPVRLGKEILLGPDVYDFNGTRRYNVMVLHKDHTVEMYNMKGQKPASWKGIRSEEKIMGLPERIKVGGTSFWVVRTSLQTLIYPFYGGDPLTVFEGDKRIKKDSEIKIIDQTSVEFSCYDGRQRKLSLK